jgi:hypothetical protein
MKKLGTIFILVLSIFLLTACLPKKDQKQTQQQDQQGQVEKPESESFTGSLMDLLKLGKAMKCTYSYTQESTAFQGTSYVSGDKMRTDMEGVVPTEEGDQQITSHFISDGTWTYNWSSMQDQGMKMKLSELEDAGEETDTEDQDYYEQANLDKNFEYKCSPWIVDSSMFVPPSDIEFIDYTQMMQGLQESMESGDMNESLCAACEMAKDEAAIAECKANLGCE